MIIETPAANAADLGLSYWGNFDLFESSSTMKVAETTCHDGKQLFSGGFSTLGIAADQHWIVLKGVVPEGNTVRSVAVEDTPGTIAGWKLGAWRTCGNFAVVQVKNQSVADSVGSKVTQATCPAGKRVVGASAVVFSGGSNVILESFYPDDTLTNVTAIAREHGPGYAGKWDLAVYAMCADFSFPGLELVKQWSVSANNSSSEKSATAVCPPGKVPLGVGAEMDGGGGQVHLREAKIEGGLHSVVVRAVEDKNGYSGNWNLRAHAICAFP
jgi:hypothetical protein